MKLSGELLDAVEAALPGPEAPGLRAQDVHEDVGRWGRTTIRHALGALARAGRAEFAGKDRHRRYRRARGDAAGRMAGCEDAEPPIGAHPSIGANDAVPEASGWRGYGARPDGCVRLPDGRAIAELMRKLALRYENVTAIELKREQTLPGWRGRLSNAELTRVVFGDPRPGRSARG